MKTSHNDVRISEVTSFGQLLAVPIAPTFPLHLRAATPDADLVHHHLPNPLAVTSHVLTGSSRPKTVATYHNDIVRQSKALQAYRPVFDRFLANTDRINVT